MPPHRPRQPGDGWVECGCGLRHWGLFGAAGLLLVRRDDGHRATAVVLQHRAEWSHHGGTWGIPGGARMPDEDEVAAALREAAEEAGIDPVSVRVDTEGTGKVDDARICEVVKDFFPLTPGGIIKYLDLRRPIFRKTAAGGHFGRTEAEFTWEKTDRAKELAEAVGAPAVAGRR